MKKIPFSIENGIFLFRFSLKFLNRLSDNKTTGMFSNFFPSFNASNISEKQKGRFRL